MFLLSRFGRVELSDGYVSVRESSKGNRAVATECRGRFLRHAIPELGHELAERLFGAIEKSAGLTCCKSHQLANAMTTYQSAYLKVHHRIEFNEVVREATARN